MMKTYFGTFLPGVADHKVAVRDDETGVTLPLRHHSRHSPTGFNWGYGGSGPAELARCLLLDHLGGNELDDLNRDTGFLSPFDRLVPPVLYQQFKADVVSQWPMDRGWTMTGAEVDDWLNTKGAWHRERLAS